MLFDYQALLQLDNETYEDWTPRLTSLENTAITQAKLINGTTLISSANDTLKQYASEYIFMQEYGDELSQSLYKYHAGQLQMWEEAIRYGV